MNQQERSRGTQLEDIFSSENLSLAWKQVLGNKGAAGVVKVKRKEPDHHIEPNNDGPVQQSIASGLKPKAIFGVGLILLGTPA
ncbi:MAG: hypothetical protein ACJAVK_001511 [Akkermansiaceae bacterium]